MDDKEQMDTLAHVKEHVRLGKAKWERIFSRCRQDLRMSSGVEGQQFTEQDKTVRGKNRAMFSVPVLDKFVEQIVGEYNSDPFGIDFEAADPSAIGPAQGLSGLIGGIEQESNAQFAYRHALRNSSACGYGWLYVTTEYADEYGASTDTVARIMPILSPTSIILDPLSVAIDGRDAEWAVHQDTMGLATAKKEYGEDILSSGNGGDSGFVDERTMRYASSRDSVPVVTHYERDHKWRTVWLDADGIESDKKSKTNTVSKRIKSTTIKVTKIVGNKIVSENELPIKCLPIIPVYGLPYWANDCVEYVGVVHRAIDSQRIANYAVSLGAERLALSPKSNFMGSSRAIGNWIEQWKNSARDNNPVLLYEDQDKMGNPIQSPIQLKTSVDLSDTLGMIQGMMGMISEVVGMPPIGIGAEGARQQTAEEALLRNRSKQTVNSTIYENLAASIERLGYVTAELVLATYDTERDITVTEKDGKVARVRTNVSEAGIDLNQMKVRVKAGPLMSTQRKDNMRSYIALGQMLGPQYTAVIGPKIAESIDNADQQLIEGIKAIAQASMGGGQDPNAQAEGDQLRQALAQAQQTILALQMKSRDTEIEILAKQALTEQEHQNDIEMEVLKQQGTAGLEQEKAALKAESDEASDYRKVQMAIAEQQAKLDREYNSL